MRVWRTPFRWGLEKQKTFSRPYQKSLTNSVLNIFQAVWFQMHVTHWFKTICNFYIREKVSKSQKNTLFIKVIKPGYIKFLFGLVGLNINKTENISYLPRALWRNALWVNGRLGQVNFLSILPIWSEGVVERRGYFFQPLKI